MKNLIRLSLLALFSITLFACNEDEKQREDEIKKINSNFEYEIK